MVIISEGTRSWIFPNLLEEEKELRLGYSAIALDVDGGKQLPHFKLIESARLVEGGVELVEEVVDLLELEGAAPVVVIDLEYLVDVHPEDIVVHANLN